MKMRSLHKIKQFCSVKLQALLELKRHLSSLKQCPSGITRFGKESLHFKRDDADNFKNFYPPTQKTPSRIMAEICERGKKIASADVRKGNLDGADKPAKVVWRVNLDGTAGLHAGLHRAGMKIRACGQYFLFINSISIKFCYNHRKRYKYL